MAVPGEKPAPVPAPPAGQECADGVWGYEPGPGRAGALSSCSFIQTASVWSARAPVLAARALPYLRHINKARASDY